MINFSNYIKCKNEKDVLRERYINEDIFLVGTKIIHDDRIGKIIRRGPNYVISLDENEKVFRSWITDIKEYHEEMPKKINKYRNYNNSRDNMDSVNSTAFFIGMLPEHSYKIRRSVERTILEGMDYDSAVDYISEDLKSDFLVSKAVEYFDIVIAEADQQMIAAKKQIQQQKDQMQKQAMQKKLQMQKQELQKRMQKQAQKSSQMKEEDEVEIEEAWLRRAKRERINPNKLRDEARKGSRLAQMIRNQKGLGEEEVQEDKPCWKDYEMIGMKKINGKPRPNCVHKEELTKKQKKIARLKPPYDKIDANDLASLRAHKKSMKEQEQVGGVSSGFGFQGVYGASGKKYRKEEFSDWRNEISLSDNLVEKVSGESRIKINPKTDDCPNCGEKMHRSTCPNCDTGDLRTKYREESYEIIEKHLTGKMKNKVEDIVKGMKKSIGELKSRYGDRWKEVMYATATKRAMAAEEVESLDEAQERYGVYDRKKGSFVQTGLSQQSAKLLYRRLIGSGRSSREVTIRKVNY
jgi:hypothetical protein